MKGKTVLFLAITWGLLFALVEAGSWMVLKFSISRHPSDNPLVNEYVARGAPLFTDNDDLRVRSQGFAFHPYLGYRQAPGYTTLRPHREYTGHVEVDAAGFVHTGDRERNPTALAKPKGQSYRVVFLGGSTMFGLGASSNQTTIPADFERLLRQTWPGVDFLVLNAGAQGYVSTQERIAYELYLDAVDPDLVVAMDGVNDAMVAGDLATWKPHFNAVNILDEAAFVRLHQPSVNFADTMRDLVQFPEPLASLALLRRILSHLPAAAGPHDLTATYHPEAVTQLRDNLDALARQLGSERRLGLFVLQPYLGYAKGGVTDEERAIIAGYGDRIDVYNRHFADFTALYDDLGRQFAGQGSQFVDMRSLFATADRFIYHSLAHYNDGGDDVLAQAMLDRIKPALTADLKAKGLVQ